jgi:hypothetical protein
MRAGLGGTSKTATPTSLATAMDFRHNSKVPR